MRKVVKNSSDARLQKTPNIFLLFILTWVCMLYVATFFGLVSDFSSMPPKFVMVVLIPMITILYFTFSKRTEKMLQLVPHSWLVNIQAFRILVELLLWWMFVEYLLPERMTFEGMNFDILAGLTAPIAVVIFFKKGNVNKTAGIVWNIFGLALLINIVSIAVLSLPTPFQVFTDQTSSAIVSVFPFVLLPGVLVPLAYTMHFLSLRKLISENK
jgi:hypothetical protein